MRGVLAALAVTVAFVGCGEDTDPPKDAVGGCIIDREDPDFAECRIDYPDKTSVCRVPVEEMEQVAERARCP